jgi:hypothetical protein
VFTSFGFKWPIQLTKLFDAASATSFNEQLMAPECSIGAWGFELKYVAWCRIPMDARLPSFGNRTHCEYRAPGTDAELCVCQTACDESHDDAPYAQTWPRSMQAVAATPTYPML